jgi:hypothetical protein
MIGVEEEMEVNPIFIGGLLWRFLIHEQMMTFESC